MNRYQAKLDPPVRAADSGSEPERTGAPRTNRLSRSFRLTQRDSPRSPCVPEFRTPRSKPAPVFCGESPLSDSDIQQDIIWDASSPLARRPGKRGKKHSSGVVNISEIVSRIAPKSGRPEAAEPGLQQWFGDSATIPCTPDLQAPRTKRKSPRASSVEDLLWLAKRFDHNVCRPQEDLQDKNLDPQVLDPQDLDPQDLHQNQPLASLQQSHRLALDLAPGTDLDLQDLVLEDLDFLFDGSTQNLSLDLSQTPSGPSEDCRRPPGPGGSCSARGAFEDDWENDDLLKDLLELDLTQNHRTLTQNLQNLVPPKLCSTQKLSGPSETRPKVQKENLRPRLESRPGFSGFRTEPDWQDQQVDYRSKENQRTGSLSGPGLHRTGPTCLRPEPLRSEDLRSSGTFRPDPVDFMDLDLLFSSDPVWDDPADDELLCQMCEDLENQNQNLHTKHAPVPSNHRAALQPTHRTCRNRVQTGPGGSSSPGGAAGRTGSLVTTATSKGKCSAAEIRLKRQRALERRYQVQQNRPDTRDCRSDRTDLVPAGLRLLLTGQQGLDLGSDEGRVGPACGSGS